MNSLAVVFVCIFATISATKLAPVLFRFLHRRRSRTVAEHATQRMPLEHVPYEESGRDPLIVHLCNRPDVRALTSGGRVYFA